MKCDKGPSNFSFDRFVTFVPNAVRTRWFMICVALLYSLFTVSLVEVSVQFSAFSIAAFYYEKAVALATVGVFWSAKMQIVGLVGEEGILPVRKLVSVIARSQVSHLRFLSIFRWKHSDTFLVACCWYGIVGGSWLLIVDFLPIKLLPCILQWVAPLCRTMLWVTIWIVYLSIIHVGREFWALQFDNLFLDSLLPCPLLPWTSISGIPLLLDWWLLFRLMFSSGVVKLASRDINWRTGEAMSFHYFSQPLPSPMSWYAHQLPMAVHKFGCFAHFFIELVVPYFIFTPWRVWSAPLLALLQVAILSTGNYGFFNLLSIILCIPLIEDQYWPSLARDLYSFVEAAADAPFVAFPSSTLVSSLLNILCGVFVVLFAIVSLPTLSKMTRRPIHYVLPPQVVKWLTSSSFTKIKELFATFPLINGYGLFAVMTTTRAELIFEGSNDLHQWKEYHFKYKPGRIDRPPCFLPIHLPRLDWRLWFCQ